MKFLNLLKFSPKGTAERRGFWAVMLTTAENPGERPQLRLCPGRWALSPAGARGAASAPLAPGSHFRGWVTAVPCLRVPRRLTPPVPPRTGWGARVPRVGEREVCGHPRRASHGSVPAPHAGPGSSHPRQAALPNAGEGQQAPAKAALPTAVSLWHAPSVPLSGFSSLQICFWSLSERLPPLS